VKKQKYVLFTERTGEWGTRSMFHDMGEHESEALAWAAQPEILRWLLSENPTEMPKDEVSKVRVKIMRQTEDYDDDQGEP
jgi:hypothetical protein